MQTDLMTKPQFIGPLNAGQATNAERIGETAVRWTLYRYFVLGMRNF